MLPRQPSSSNTTVHLLKMRRVSTYNHPSHTHSSLQQTFAQDSPCFRERTQYKTELPQKRGNFISSLITKLKNVERPQKSSSYGRQGISMKGPPQENMQNLQKMSKLMINKKLSNQTQIVDKFPFNCYPQTHSKLDFSNIEQIQLQNSILKDKVNELIIQNEKLKLRFNKINKDVKEKEDQFAKKEEELNRIQAQLILKQQLLDQHITNFHPIPKDAKEENGSISQTVAKISQIAKLSIFSQMNEVVFPIQCPQLAKATQEIKQLRLEKLQIQKKFTSNLSQYRKKKEDQIERMKRGFTSKLAHYKDLLLKVSFKPSLQIKKYQEDTFQTVILQTSSADES